MILERALNVVFIGSWVIFLVFVLRYVIRTTLSEGFWVALRKLFRLKMIYILLAFAACVSALYLSAVFVEPQEVGVVVSLASPNGYRPRPLRSGLHWIIPLIEEVHTYPISWQTYSMSGKPNEGAQKGDDSIAARTSDGQEVLIDCTIIFQVNPEEAPRLYVEWQNRYIEDLIRPLLRGKIRTLVSQYKIDEVNSSKRMDLENDLTTQLSSILVERGFTMDRFLLRNISFSNEYATAVEKKQVALQDAIRKQYEADQIQKLAAGEAARVRLLAEAEANAVDLLGAALARNPEAITLRYVDKLAPNIQVMLVPNNAPYILPLPDLYKNLPTVTPTPTAAQTAVPDLNQSTPTPTATQAP